MTFQIAFDRLIGNEGGYSNNPADPGGETMWGVTLTVARWNGYNGAMKDLPRATAQAIYEKQYWMPIHGEELPFPVAFQVFDAAVNHGVQEAVKLLQAACGVLIDGQIGPQTIGAAGGRLVGLKYLADRLRYYAAIPGTTFDHGWMNRTAMNLDWLYTDLAAP